MTLVQKNDAQGFCHLWHLGALPLPCGLQFGTVLVVMAVNVVIAADIDQWPVVVGIQLPKAP
jgi:hypothetical protein